MDTEQYLTIEEVAKKLKIAQATAYRMVKRGDLPGIKIGKVWRISGNRLREMFNGKKK
jgi:putative molybdopterin biosynthesis protein